MYKLGVMSAVIMMTLFLAFKGVMIGTLILIMNLAFFAVKLGALLKFEHKPAVYAAPQPTAWAPPPVWGQQKDVHLHIHNGYGSKTDYSFPYSTVPNVASGWHENVNSEPQPWGSYGGHGRSLDKNHFVIYPSNTQSNSIDRIGRSDSNEQQSPEPIFITSTTTTTHKPMLVTGQTRPVIVPPIASYHFRQNKK